MSTILLCSLLATTATADDRPNVIVMLADDLGYTGLGCFGSDLHETPHLDRLAARGMKFTSAYSACTVCSPTRASLMTGKYPARLHLTDFIAGQNRPFAKLRVPDWNKQLEPSEITIAESLQTAGYATAHVGKWHLSPRGREGGGRFSPTGQGFDVQILKPPGTRGYLLSEKWLRRSSANHRYLTDHLTDEAVQVIERWKDRPFFLYLAYHTPHTPIQGKESLVRYYEKQLDGTQRHDNPAYAAMVHSLDESVGRIVNKLQQEGIAQRTLIWFMSDNGGLSQKFGKPTGFIDNDPLRRGKGSAYEGGVRVPMIVDWPGVTQPGSVCDEPVCSIDVYPTLAEIAGVEPVRPPEVDGLSLKRLLQQQSRLDREALYWHYPHYHAGGDSPYGAVRAGRWRLVEFYEDQRTELYDLHRDLGETHDLSREMPQKTRELRDRLHALRRNVGAQMPTVNPNYDAEKARRMARGEKIRQ